MAARNLKIKMKKLKSQFKDQNGQRMFFLLFALVFFIFLFPFSIASAATLLFSPSSGSYNVGGTFSVDVQAESPDQPMNAASGVVSFPWDKLEVISLSKSESIFSLWPAEPSFSNGAGTVNFEGIVLNPGFTGANGKILTITFKVKREGQANLSFSSGSVLANDGSGTNILNGLQVAVFTLTEKTETRPAQKKATDATAATMITNGNTFVITSPTHPDQTKWYADNTPEFSWDLPLGALEIRTLIGKSPSGMPSVSYIPPISSKKVDELADGVYYFSLQARTAGEWSAVSRYRVNIDTTPPKSFSVTFPHGNKGFEPQPIAYFNTTDSESGVSHYNISIGSDGKPERVAPIAISNPYVLPVQYPGSYTLIVTAVDNAGNTRTASTEFVIESIDAPIITYYPDRIESGNIVKIRGTTYPNSGVNVNIREGDKLISEEYTKSDALGDFTLIVAKQLDLGTYAFTARVTDERGAKSEETIPFTIEVDSKFIFDLMDIVLEYLSIVILILLALGSVAGTGVYLLSKISSAVRRMRREAMEAENVSEKAFYILHKDIETHIARLEKSQSKRKLTVEEVLFLEEFKKNLKEAENIIAKEIKDISRS